MTENKLKILDECKKLFKLVEKLTKKYQEYNYTLNQHIIRTVISIGSNIAEGNNLSEKLFIKHLYIAIGSCDELSFQVSLYDDENCIDILDMIDKIKATCYKLIKYRMSVVGDR